MTKKTKIFTVYSIEKDYQQLVQAAAILRAGGLVAIPTETVYGLGADATNSEAVSAIFAAKGRPQDNPLIVHIHALEQLTQIAREIPPVVFDLAQAFWPGPLTIILPKTDYIPAVTSGGLDTVAVRLPGHPIARELIRLAGVPLAAPSANRSGSPSTTTAQHCLQDLDGRVDAIVDAGACTVGLESTVISLAEKIPVLLRPGAVTPEALRKILPELRIDPAVTSQPAADAKVSSPGMKYRHYAPSCQVVLLRSTRDEYISWVNAHVEDGVFALCANEDMSALQCPVLSLGSASETSDQAARLFAALRELDENGAKIVYARCPEPSGMGLALYNRMIRAAAFRIIDL